MSTSWKGVCFAPQLAARDRFRGKQYNMIYALFLFLPLKCLRDNWFCLDSRVVYEISNYSHRYALFIK